MQHSFVHQPSSCFLHARARNRRKILPACMSQSGQGTAELCRYMTLLNKEEQADALSKFIAAGFTGAKQQLVPRLSNQELESIGIQPQSVRSALLQAFADGELYKGIVLYTPFGKDRYLQRNLKQTTRKQLTAKLSAKGYDTVAVVDSMPLQLLGPDCDGAMDIDDVELADGIQLAVVVDAVQAPVDKLSDRVSDVENLASEHAGWQRGRIRADENRSREWAMQHLMQNGHTGVRPYCYKEITLKQGSKIRQIEVDGMAVSDTAVVLVERKPIINMKHVDELIEKLDDYQFIVDGNAPNTAQLATTATILTPRKRKPVQAVLMADGWVDNEYERAACKQAMLRAGILPVLPRADSHAPGDSCNPWPPHPDDLALAQYYLPPRIKATLSVQ